MDITPQLLLRVGFTELTWRPHYYDYKGIVGHLEDDGCFWLEGLSQPLKQVNDLQYIIGLIDYQRKEEE